MREKFGEGRLNGLMVYEDMGLSNFEVLYLGQMICCVLLIFATLKFRVAT